MLSDLVASSWFGVTRDDAIFARHSDMKRMKRMTNISAGPLISKFAEERIGAEEIE